MKIKTLVRKYQSIPLILLALGVNTISTVSAHDYKAAHNHRDFSRSHSNYRYNNGDYKGSYTQGNYSGSTNSPNDNPNNCNGDQSSINTSIEACKQRVRSNQNYQYSAVPNATESALRNCESSCGRTALHDGRGGNRINNTPPRSLSSGQNGGSTMLNSLVTPSADAVVP